MKSYHVSIIELDGSKTYELGVTDSMDDAYRLISEFVITTVGVKPKVWRYWTDDGATIVDYGSYTLYGRIESATDSKSPINGI